MSAFPFRRCKKCKRKLPIDVFDEVRYEPMPGRVTVYHRWVCKQCILKRKKAAYRALTDRQRKERRATQRMAADDKRRAEGKPARVTKNHLT